MGEIIDLKKYREFQDGFRFVKKEELKKHIEENRIGDFWGRTDEEVENFYNLLTDKLNDMVEKPSGETSFEVGKLLADYKISPFDFDSIFSLIKESKSQENKEIDEDLEIKEQLAKEIAAFFDEGDSKKLEDEIESLSDEEFELFFVKGELNESKEPEEKSIFENDDDHKKIIDIINRRRNEFQEEIEEDETIREIDEKLDEYANEIEQNKLKNEFNKIGNPFSLISKITGKISKNIEKLKNRQEYKSTSPNIATRLAALFGKAKSVENEVEESKSTIASKIKKINLRAKAKKGTAQKTKQNAEFRKNEKIRKTIEKGKEISDLLIKKYEKNLNEDRVDIESIKNENLKFYISKIRNNEIEIGSGIGWIRRTAGEEYENKINFARMFIDKVQTEKISKDLKQLGLTNQEIENLIYSKNIIKDMSKYEGIQGTEVEEKLKTLASIPRVSELTDDEVLQLSKSIKIQNGKIRINFSYLYDGKTNGDLSWITNSKEDIDKDKFIKRKVGKRLHLFKKLYGEKFYDPELEEDFKTLSNNYEEAYIYEKLFDEADNIEMLSDANKIHVEFNILSSELEELQEYDELNRMGKKHRNLIEKIARDKVAVLEKQGVSISSQIDKNGNETGKILNEGKKELKLDKVIYKDSREMDDLMY